jgi:hypothetical protein
VTLVKCGCTTTIPLLWLHGVVLLACDVALLLFVLLVSLYHPCLFPGLLRLLLLLMLFQVG